MSRKPVEINKVSCERLKTLINGSHYTQKEIAQKLGYTEQHLSLIVTGKRNLTDSACYKLIELFPHVRPQWLKGYDDSHTALDYPLFHAFVEAEKEYLQGFDVTLDARQCKALAALYELQDYLEHKMKEQ